MYWYTREDRKVQSQKSLYDGVTAAAAAAAAAGDFLNNGI